MSKSEVERFAKDLKTKPALLDDLVALAARHGYRFTADDAKALSDGELDAVAGGYRQQVLATEPKTVLADDALGLVSAGRSLESALRLAEAAAEKKEA